MSEFDNKEGKEFEQLLRKEVEEANRRARGLHPSPWEVVMEALISLEKRIRK